MSQLIDKIRQSVIGEGTLIETEFGKKPLIYADYTASGRGLTFIEEYIQRQVLPFYANTHTEISFTGAQTTALREQARQQIKQAVNARAEDQVIFCGSGATAAIHKLIDTLNIRLPADLNERYKLDTLIPEAERPVVFIGPYEHHSNEIPWRESIATVVAIPLNEQGQIDLKALECKLKMFSHRTLKIGSFSAASNVTGIQTDVEAVACLLHRHGALSFWDYAAAAPYVGIDMIGQGEGGLDGVFISPHKFIGGPGTPGVLVIKKEILNNSVPAMPGGGTVMYVTPEDHRYIENTERREEGGTPAIIESIRAGLVFKLQQAVGTDKIEQRESDFVARALARWSACSNIKVLAESEVPRLSITSFRIKHEGQDLHYGFVVALLNDLFGLQVRGGCSCAGPYGHALLGMDMDYSKALEAQLLAGHTILRPGWVRLNFNYFIDELSFEYIVRAVELVAEFGWRLLPYYCYDPAVGVWRFQAHRTELPSNLNEWDFETNSEASEMIPGPESLTHYLESARRVLCEPNRRGNKYTLTLPNAAEKLRWFTLPQEINPDINSSAA